MPKITDTAADTAADAQASAQPAETHELHRAEGEGMPAPIAAGTAPIIRPTVGRVIWVFKRDGQVDTSQPEVALVTYVHGDRCINVAGYDANGLPFALSSLFLRQDGDPDPHTTHAEWMPYQKGQAARADRSSVRVGSTVLVREPGKPDAPGIVAEVNEDTITCNVFRGDHLPHVAGQLRQIPPDCSSPGWFWPPRS